MCFYSTSIIVLYGFLTKLKIGSIWLVLQSICEERLIKLKKISMLLRLYTKNISRYLRKCSNALYLRVDSARKIVKCKLIRMNNFIMLMFIFHSKTISRKQPLNSMDIFTFCWTLFVFVKSNFAKIGDDLVNSYHLLLVCIDYCFSSVLSFDNYRDIVNTNFYGKY